MNKKLPKNKTVIVRCGFNVPLVHAKNKETEKMEVFVEDDFRIRESLETLQELSRRGNRIVIISHIGRDKKMSLEPVFLHLKDILESEKDDDVEEDITISFHKNTFLDYETLANKKREKKLDHIKSKIESLESGQILLLDNIRATTLEKENSEEFAQELVSLGDFYINDAFSVSHRNHTSVDALARQFSLENKSAGLLFQKEIQNLQKCFDPRLFIDKNKKGQESAGLEKDQMTESKKSSENVLKKEGEKREEEKVQSVFILGGAKLPTKAPLLTKFLDIYDMVVVGGVLANTFYKKLGYEVGKSKVEELKNIPHFDIEKIVKHENFFLPNIVAVKNRNGKISEKEIDQVGKNDTIVDISPTAFLEIEEILSHVQFAVMNGPLGYYEEGYVYGSEHVLEILHSPKNHFVAGGGNTVSLIHELGFTDYADFLSTAGGAMIYFLDKKNLPGIDSLS